MKLIKYLKGFLVPMIFLVAILGVRVVAELALPTYTSNIVDKGIQQSGIEDAVPEKISEKSFRELQLFMTDDEIKKVTSKYTKDGDIYKLDSINEQERSELNDILKELKFEDTSIVIKDWNKRDFLVKTESDRQTTRKQEGNQSLIGYTLKISEEYMPYFNDQSNTNFSNKIVSLQNKAINNLKL